MNKFGKSSAELTHAVGGGGLTEAAEVSAAEFPSDSSPRSPPATLGENKEATVSIKPSKI